MHSISLNGLSSFTFYLPVKELYVFSEKGILNEVKGAVGLLSADFLGYEVCGIGAYFKHTPHVCCLQADFTAAEKLNTSFVKTKQIGESETSTLSTTMRLGPEERGRGGVFAYYLAAKSKLRLACDTDG